MLMGIARASSVRLELVLCTMRTCAGTFLNANVRPSNGGAGRLSHTRKNPPTVVSKSSGCCAGKALKGGMINSVQGGWLPDAVLQMQFQAPSSCTIDSRLVHNHTERSRLPNLYESSAFSRFNP